MLEENLKGGVLLKHVSISGRIILKCILKKQDMRLWPRLIWHRTEGSYETGNKTLGSI
jgi:hypothetical protein